MKGMFVFIVSAMWICDVSSSSEDTALFQITPRCKQCVCSESACKGQSVLFKGGSSKGKNGCRQIGELFKCGDRDMTGPCNKEDLKVYCCVDTQADISKSVKHFTCENEPVSEDSPRTGTLVGGVIGGLIGGAVITGAVVLLCRKLRRHQESPGKQLADTHAYLGPGPTGDSPDKDEGTNKKTSSVPDLVKTSVEPVPGEYAVISESADAGDYTEITEDISGAAAVFSMTSANHVMTTLGGRKADDPADNLTCQYNILREANLTPTRVQATYNRLGDNNLASGSSAEYFVLEEPAGNYNRLGQAAAITTTDATSGYHRLGDTVESGSPQSKDTEASPPYYFVLEGPADTYNKLGVAVAETVMGAKDTYHRLGKTDGDTRNRESEPF